MLELAGGRARLYDADCREVLFDLDDDTIDSAVMDPPYALVSVAKRFGKEGSAPAKFGKDGLYARASASFMGEDWDTGETSFSVDFWRDVYRVLKPGGWLVAFGGTRTYHRLATAIEGAGFDIRDQIQWIYGSGFPKNHDLALNFDKANGYTTADQRANGGPISEEAKHWEGWGTAIKPANEPICLARKPFGGTLVENVRQWGVGALNIKASRVGSEGRWPANVIHDGSEEVVEAFPDATSRFFYCAKAQTADRDEGLEAFSAEQGKRKNGHPTVKPTPLMRYLVRLVTPPGGIVLDPFSGSGSTGKAAMLEGARFIGIERVSKYIPIAEARIRWAAERADWAGFLGENA